MQLVTEMAAVKSFFMHATHNKMSYLALQDIKTADWSQNVAPFWPAVIRSALTWKGLTSLLRSGKLCSIPGISDSFSLITLNSSFQMTINYCQNTVVITIMEKLILDHYII